MLSSFPLGPFDYHHDSCGVGFVADRRRRRTHRTTRLAVRCLRSLDHRGAKSADGTGDGAGLLTRIPQRLLVRELEHGGVEPPEESRIGVLMVFLPIDDSDRYREAIRLSLEAEDVRLLIARVSWSSRSPRAFSVIP